MAGYKDMFSATPSSLLEVLQRRSRSRPALERTLADACADLGLGEGDSTSPICVAYALLKLRAEPDEVSRLLSWREFEGLAGAIMRVSGFDVSENVFLTKPRAQIDVVAYGTSVVLSVDCKHYRREQGPSSLARFAAAQLRRSALLRKKSGDSRPIVSVILGVAEPEGKFVDGVAVVPVRSLRSFLNTIDSHLGALELR